MKPFNISKWNRAKQFSFFKDFEDPFFAIQANLEVGKLYDYCKKNKLSFFLSYLFVALKACNEILEFRLRLKNGTAYEFEKISCGSTISNEDNTFSICYFENDETLEGFVRKGKQTIESYRSGNVFETRDDDLDVIHCTTIPWLAITGFKHARRGDEKDKGIPKLVFGKVFEEEGVLKMPLSVEAHHALMDGFHVAQLFEKMKAFMDELP